MSLFRKKPQKEVKEILINNDVYKLSIHTENRRNSRVSITKTGINVRLASYLSVNQKQEQLSKFIAWAEKTISEKVIVFRPENRVFVHEEKLKLYDKEIEILIKQKSSSKVSGKIDHSFLLVTVPFGLEKELQDEYVAKMVARLLAKNYKQKITEKLHAFNTQFQFGTIKDVRLKNNSSNWGSCSSKNNINISVRLLLAPESVLDYVLIHELCHLKHRNHSNNFWNLVAQCCPEYQKAEVWLKKNATACII